MGKTQGDPREHQDEDCDPDPDVGVAHDDEAAVWRLSVAEGVAVFTDRFPENELEEDE